MIVDHIHPRHWRRRHPEYKPAPYEALHRPLVPVPAGASAARRWFSYKGARARLDDGVRPAQRLKRERLELGITRREYDRRRTEYAKGFASVG